MKSIKNNYDYKKNKKRKKQNGKSNNRTIKK
jgi:hypothetical protein